jgi:hypothetical protein
MARRCESYQPVRRTYDAFGLWRNDFFLTSRGDRVNGMIRLKYSVPIDGQTARPPSANHSAGSCVQRPVRGDCRPTRRKTRRMPWCPFAGLARWRRHLSPRVSGGSDEAANECPAFTRRSRHRRDVVATRARSMGRYCGFACRLCVSGSTRASDGEDRGPAAACKVQPGCAEGTAMTTIATLLGWLMALLSTGPLLLALVMLTMLRGRSADDL